MSLILATLALTSLTEPAGPPYQEPPSPASAENEIVRSARTWLGLVDAGRWDASWNATGQGFRALNTSRTWASVSERVRPPLGAVLSRNMISQERLPAPPYGYEVVKFRTSFANKPDTTETLSLVREGSDWKVVGYLIG